MASQTNGGQYVAGNLVVAGNTTFTDLAVVGLTASGNVAVSGTLTALQPQTAVAVSGAVAIAAGTFVITKDGVCAATLAAPTAAQAGTRMTFTSATDNAHTLTATGLIQDGVTGGAKNLATFAAFAGASVTLEAYGLKWNVLSLNAVTIS